MEQKNLEKLKEIAEEFFEKMGFEVELVSLEQRDETISLDLRMEEVPAEAAILIGERGQTLFEIQHLLKAILKKKSAAKSEPKKENFYLDLDINDYKKKKTVYLKELARTLADEVVLTKQEKELPAMPAAERRIIHLELASRPDITTQSVGQEPNRRIIVSPHP